MASHSDGNLTVWKDWRRIVPSHSTKYCKKSFLGLKKKKKSPTMDFQGSVGVPAVARRPPVHMLMSRGLIVSSYFNLLRGNGGREGGKAGRSVSMRKRWDERKRDDRRGDEGRAEAVGRRCWRMGRKSCGVGKEKVRLKERADEGHERAGWHY